MSGCEDEDEDEDEAEVGGFEAREAVWRGRRWGDRAAGLTGEVFITSNFSLIFSSLIILLVGQGAGAGAGGGVGEGGLSSSSSSSSSRTTSLASDPTHSEPLRARSEAKESLSLCFAALNRTPIFLSSPHS